MNPKIVFLASIISASASSVSAGPLTEDAEYRYLYFSVKIAEAELFAALQEAKAKMWLAFYEMQRSGMSESEARQRAAKLALSEEEIELARDLIKDAKERFERYKFKHYPNMRPGYFPPQNGDLK